MDAYAHSKWVCPNCGRVILSRPGLRPRKCNECKTGGDDLSYRGGHWDFKEPRDERRDPRRLPGSDPKTG